MDPQRIWDQFVAAFAEGDWDVIEKHAADLHRWLDAGGVPPKVLPQLLGPHFNRALARAGCEIALEILQSEWRTVPEPA